MYQVRIFVPGKEIQNKKIFKNKNRHIQPKHNSTLPPYWAYFLLQKKFFIVFSYLFSTFRDTYKWSGQVSVPITPFQGRVGSGYFKMARIMVGLGRDGSAFWIWNLGFIKFLFFKYG